MTRKISRKKEENPRVQVCGVNFYYAGVHIEYDNGTSYCDCKDYCRCKTIVNTRVTSVDLQQVAKGITNTNTKCAYSTTDLYCIDRILRIHKAYDPKSWGVSIHQGYYGEEIGSVHLHDGIGYSIQEDINKVLAMDSITQKIEFILTLEYGYLLEDLFGCQYRLELIDKSQISYQREHYTKLDRTVVDSYKEHLLPRGIVLHKDASYRLIDGYHRTAAANGTFSMFVASKK